MKTEIPGVEWYLDCEPRVVQLEALARSFLGQVWRNTKNDELIGQPIDYIREDGKPASGFPFFMQMRLGKTPTLLNEFLMFHFKYGMKKLLVFSPSKYKFTWAKEAERFGLSMYDMPVFVFESSDYDRVRASKFVENKQGILIVNYEALVYPNNCEIIERFVDKKTIVAADESVKIKNKETIFFDKSKQFALMGRVRRPMTGKPIVQGPHDLWAQLRFAGLLDGVAYYAFRGRYCEMKAGFKGKKKIRRDEK